MKSKENAEIASDAVLSEREFEKICAYCEGAVPLYDSDIVLCRRNGIVSAAHHCRKFIYDPLKRRPAKPLRTPELEYIDIDGK